MSEITDLYQCWVEAEAYAQIGDGTLAEAKAAKARFADAAKSLVAKLPFKTIVIVRGIATARVDVAEHVAPKGEDIAPSFLNFSRKAGQAFCDRRLVESENAFQVSRRAPSCARCLLIAEELVDGAEE